MHLRQNIAMGSNYTIFREMLIIGILKHKNSYLVEMIEGLFLNLTAHTYQETIWRTICVKQRKNYGSLASLHTKMLII